MDMPANRISYDEPAEVYYRPQLDVANYSGLKVLHLQSPAHYLYRATAPDVETEAKRFGKAAHVALLEPERFGDCYRVLPADRPKDLRHLRDAAKPSQSTLDSIAWWDEWTAGEAGTVTLEAGEFALIQAMAASLRALRMDFPGVTITAGELFATCRTEVTVRWVDEETGLACKARADLYSEEFGFVGDPKFCRGASWAAFARDVNQFCYHLQHAHYCEGFRACGAPLKAFAYFPVEKEAPHVPASWCVGPASEARGWEIRQKAMTKLARCLQRNEWPGYTTTLTPIEIPAYGMYDAGEETSP
jgi:hypothetical protein